MTVARARRVPMLWAVACVAGAALVLLAAGRRWATVTYDQVPGAPGAVTLTGGQLVGHLTSSALAAAAAAIAVLAVRGAWKRVIGAVVSLCGVAVVLGVRSGVRAGAVTAAAADHGTLAAAGAGTASIAPLWPAIAIGGGAVLVAAGLVAIAVAGRWPGMSGRYDRVPAAGARSAVSADRALWDALDRGDDPTADGDRAA